MEIISTGSTTALIASVGTSVSTTLGSLLPLIGMIGGVALAILLTPWVIGLFRQAGPRARSK